MQSLVAELNKIERDANGAVAPQLHALLGATFKVAETAHSLGADAGSTDGIPPAEIEAHAEALVLKLHQLIANQRFANEETPRVLPGSQPEYLAPGLVLPEVFAPALQAA